MKIQYGFFFSLRDLDVCMKQTNIYIYFMFWQKLSILILDLYFYSIKIQTNIKQNLEGKRLTCSGSRSLAALLEWLMVVAADSGSSFLLFCFCIFFFFLFLFLCRPFSFWRWLCGCWRLSGLRTVALQWLFFFSLLLLPFFSFLSLFFFSSSSRVFFLLFYASPLLPPFLISLPLYL